MEVPPNEQHFTSYPKNHVLGIFKDSRAVQLVVNTLRTQGVSLDTIKVFVGEKGAEAFDDTARGLRGWFARVTRALTAEQDEVSQYTEALHRGQFIVAVKTENHPSSFEPVRAAFQAAGGTDIKFLGAFVVQTLDAPVQEP